MPPLQYTGNAGATQSPSPPPGPGAVPIFNIPRAGDRGADLWEQALKTAADYIAFLTAQLAGVSAYYGDGSDGDVTINTTVPLDGENKNYNTLTIGASGILIPRRSIVRVKGLLSINATGLIHCNGDAAVAGAHGDGSDGADLYDVDEPPNFPIAGGIGGADGQTASSAGIAGPNFVDRAGVDDDVVNVGSAGAGGAGGAGTGGAGGPGGGGAAVKSEVPDAAWFPGVLYTPANLFLQGSWTTGATPAGMRIVKARGGGGGGSGGGSGTGISGAGAAGGGVVFIIAKSIAIGSTSCIQVKGGVGGAATGGNSGGGGGGRGGRIFVFHGGATGSTLNATLCVVGGGGGAGSGTGSAGSTGGDGKLMVKQVA